MKYRRVEVGEYNPIGSFGDGNPFTTAFCRTRDHGNILVVGGLSAVRQYISHRCPALVSYRFWYKGRTRGYVRLVGLLGYKVMQRQRNGRLMLILYETPAWQEVGHWRRIPSTFPRILRDGTAK